MKISKKVISYILVSLLVFGTFINVDAASFKDTSGHWAEKVIEKWVSEGIINGYDGYFNPDASITRGDVAVILCRYKKYETIGQNTFKDLSFDDYFADEILKLSYEGIIYGDVGGYIRPLDNITREEAFVMINRICKFKANTVKQFADNDLISSWARDDVLALCANHVVNGSEGYINPTMNITRAEFVQVVENLDKATSQIDFTTVIGADDQWLGKIK